MENRRRTSFISVLIILLCISVCIGATYAYFTDSVKSDSNIIKTGKLDVTMKFADGKTDPETASWTDASTGAIFDYDLWEPGYVEVYHIKIANVGNLALKYNIVIVANGTVTELADVIDVYYFDPAVQIASRSALTDANKLGNLTTLLAGMKDTATGNLQPGKDHTITIALKMKEDAGNRYQELSIGSTFSIQLHATQLDSESDAFGPDYDGDAIIPCPHIPDLWVVDVEPTEGQEGSRHATCTICGRLFNEPIPYYKSTIRFTLSNDGTYYIASGLNDTSVKDVVIPESYNDIPVKAVADNAFSGYYEITSVTIPYGVTDIGDRAFYYCNSLETVTIPYSIATIGENAFLYAYNLTIYCRDEAVPTDWDSNWNLLRSYYDEELGEDVNEFVPVVYSWSHGAKYTYTFEADGGLTMEGEEVDSITSSAIITLPTLYKDDYIFGGWYTDAELTKKVTSSTYHSTTEHTLYAKWMTLAECFANANNNVLELDQSAHVNITTGSEKVYFAFTPQITGTYAFYTTSIVANDYTDTYGELYDSNFELLESDDDSGDSVHFQIVYELTAGETYYLEASFTSSSRTGMFNAMVTIPTTYTFHANGGTTEQGNPIKNITSATEIELPTPYHPDGLIFCGWYTNEACSGSPVLPPYYSTTNFNLYAKWETLENCIANKSVELKADVAQITNITFGGEKVFYKFTPTVGGTHTFYAFSSNEESDYITTKAYLYALEEGELVLLDFYDEDGYSSHPFEISYDLTANETYYLVAQNEYDWKTPQFMVAVSAPKTYTFETNNGVIIDEDSNTPITSVVSSWEIRLPTPTREGAIFLGWYDNFECNGDPITKYMYRAATDCTLYAKWLTPNEVSAQSVNQSLKLNQQPIVTNITVHDQKAWYVFTPEEDGTYLFFANGNHYSSYSSGHIYAYLYDSKLAEIDSYSGWDVSIEHELKANQPYYLSLEISWGNLGLFEVGVDIAGTEHKYTFETDGGSDIDDIISADGVWLETPRKEGYFFVGWYKNEECSGIGFSASSYQSPVDCTLYAKWISAEDLLKQAVLLETNRYSFTEITYAGQTAYYAFIPEFSGTYSFLIRDGGGDGTLYNPDFSVLTHGREGADGEFYEGYLKAGEIYFLLVKVNSPREHRMDTLASIIYSFETNGGKELEPIASTNGIQLPTPEKENALFLGWYNNKDCEGSALVARGDNKYRVWADCTLYAKWLPINDVGTQANSIESDTWYTVNITARGQKVIFAFTAAKSGMHKFATSTIDSDDDGEDDVYPYGCLYDSNLKKINDDYYGELDSFTCELEKDKLYYFVVESYNGNECGELRVKVVSPIIYTFATKGGTVEQSSMSGIEGICLPTPTKEGAYFVGWYEDPNLTNGGPIGADEWYSSESDCYLYAKWITAAEIEQSAPVMSLGNASSAQITAAGQTAFYVFTPTANGKYDFYTSEFCDINAQLYDSNLVELESIHYDSGFSVVYDNLEAGKTYYLAIKCYDRNATDVTVTVTVDIAYTYTFIVDAEYDRWYVISSATAVTMWTPYKDGYVFDGWYDNEACAGEPISLPYYSTTKHTLYAKWIDPFVQATTMTLNETYEIQPSNQKLYYKFTPTTAGEYEFSLSANDPEIYVELYGTLYNSSKEWIMDDYGDNFSIALTVGESTEYETYYFVIEFWGYIEGASVTLTVTKTATE